MGRIALTPVPAQARAARRDEGGEGLPLGLTHFPFHTLILYSYKRVSRDHAGLAENPGTDGVLYSRANPKSVSAE